MNGNAQRKLASWYSTRLWHARVREACPSTNPGSTRRWNVGKVVQWGACDDMVHGISLHSGKGTSPPEHTATPWPDEGS